MITPEQEIKQIEQEQQRLNKVAAHLKATRPVSEPATAETPHAEETSGPQEPENTPVEESHFGKGTLFTVPTTAGPIFVDESFVNDDTGETVPPQIMAVVVEQKKKHAIDQYAQLVEDAQQDTAKIDNPYPADSWDGTVYLEFARLCQGTGKDQNYIPPEYFINSLMTVVGAICGNRITPEFNQKTEARFITLLLSTKGGIGKGTVLEWAKTPFEGSDLLYTSGVIHGYKKIGCYVGDFGSARGMLEKFMQYPRILQEYGELSTAVEKFEIAGSGQAFRDQILNLADSQTPNWSTIKGMKVSDDAPREVHNSVIAATTTERFEQMMMRSSWETLIQRMNIVPTDETRTVFKLVVPDLTQIKDKLLPRITMLETFRLIWNLSPEAEEIAKEWHENLQSKTDVSGEDIGRIQVYLFRILGHMALWLAPLPSVDAETDRSRYTANGVFIPEGVSQDRIWRYEIPSELIRKAIKVAEHQIIARQENMPVRGLTVSGGVENLIKKWAFKQKQMRWVTMKDRARLYPYGHRICHDSLMNLVHSGVIALRKNPEDENDQRDWIVVWIGSDGKHKKWRENRGGLRKGAGRRLLA